MGTNMYSVWTGIKNALMSTQDTPQANSDPYSVLCTTQMCIEHHASTHRSCRYSYYIALSLVTPRSSVCNIEDLGGWDRPGWGWPL